MMGVDSNARLQTGGKRSQSGARRVWTIITVVIAATAGGVWLWEEVLEDRVIPKRWGAIEAGEIYRSGQLSASLVYRTLDEHDIERIVALTAVEPGDADYEAEQDAAAELGIDVIRIPMGGSGRGNPKQLADAVEAIVQAKRAGEPVLVHCAAGANRAGAVTALYRVLVQGWHPDRAVEEMIAYDWRHRKSKLLDHLNAALPEVARLLQEKGVLKEIPDPLPRFDSPRQ